MIQKHKANRGEGWSTPFIAAMTFLLLAVGGCAPPADVAPDEVIDVAAEEAAIRQLLQDQLAATNLPGEAGAEGYASFFTEDAVSLPPNQEQVNGRDAIREHALRFTGAEGWTISWAVNRVEVSSAGDLAYSLGTFEISWKDVDGNTVEDRGAFANTFRKQADGSWKISSIAISSDLPLGSPAE